MSEDRDCKEQTNIFDALPIETQENLELPGLQEIRDGFCKHYCNKLPRIAFLLCGLPLMIPDLMDICVWHLAGTSYVELNLEVPCTPPGT